MENALKIVAMNKYWLQSREPERRKQLVVRYVPLSESRQWKKDIMESMKLKVVREEQSFWVEESLMVRSKHALDQRAADYVIELSLAEEESCNYPGILYVSREKCKQLPFHIYVELEKKGFSLLVETTKRRRGYFIRPLQNSKGPLSADNAVREG